MTMGQIELNRAEQAIKGNINHTPAEFNSRRRGPLLIAQ